MEQSGAVMADRDKCLELKFRIYDGTDIGHGTYSLSISIATLKQRLLSDWPQGNSCAPKSASDIKLIHAGKVLENGKTLAESTIHLGDKHSGGITMHVVVQPSFAKRKTGKSLEPKRNGSSSALGLGPTPTTLFRHRASSLSSEIFMSEELNSLGMRLVEIERKLTKHKEELARQKEEIDKLKRELTEQREQLDYLMSQILARDRFFGSLT